MSPPTDAVLEEARRYVKVVEVPRGSNRATEIDYWLKEVGCPPPTAGKAGLPWCAAFVWNVGRQALGTPHWPLPRYAGVQRLYEWGVAQGLVRETPTVGDIFLLWEAGLTPARFGHTGFVVEVKADGSCQCQEGNTNPGGSRDGYGVFERTRHFGVSDRFLRWVLLCDGDVLAR